MFKISPVGTDGERAEVAGACGITLREGAFLYQMRDGADGHIMGCAQFEILGEYGQIYDLAEVPGSDDFEAMFILGRATMNFIDLCEVHTCVSDERAATDRMLRCLGFHKEDDGRYLANMTGMFDGHCSGHPVDLNA